MLDLVELIQFIRGLRGSTARPVIELPIAVRLFMGPLVTTVCSAVYSSAGGLRKMQRPLNP
jgi:hypothetical protein